VRTRQTVDRFARVLDYGEPVIWEEELYGADSGTLLDILSSIPAETEHAAIIGHNPSMEALVSGLCTGSTVRLNFAMPTAALAHLALDIYWWNQIRWGCGQLQILIKPKLLRAG
jgi:phosphohistidine phosphatase